MTQPKTPRLLSASDYEDALKEGKFEQGVSVPLSELPDELQENVENPPESVKKLTEEMQKQAARRSKDEKKSAAGDTPDTKAINADIKKICAEFGIDAQVKGSEVRYVDKPGKTVDRDGASKALKAAAAEQRKAKKGAEAMLYTLAAELVKKAAKAGKAASLLVSTDEYATLLRGVTATRYVVSPERILDRSLALGLITDDEKDTQNVKDAARDAAEDITSGWPEGEGFGSSDMTAVLATFLQMAGFSSTYKGGRLTRVATVEVDEKEAKFEKGKSVPVSALPDEMQENVENPPPSVQKVKDDLQKQGKFEQGVSVPVSALPDELQENVENPPPAVQKVKEELQKQSAKNPFTPRNREWVLDYMINSFMEHSNGKVEDAVEYLGPAMGEDFARNLALKWKEVRPDLWTRHGGMMGGQAVAEKLYADCVKAAKATLAKQASCGNCEGGCTCGTRPSLTAADYAAELAADKEAKFERGVSMTVDEVAAVVGPAFKEMNENPPESVLKVREEMEKQAGANSWKIWTGPTAVKEVAKALKGVQGFKDVTEGTEHVLFKHEGDTVDIATADVPAVVKPYLKGRGLQKNAADEADEAREAVRNASREILASGMLKEVVDYLINDGSQSGDRPDPQVMYTDLLAITEDDEFSSDMCFAWANSKLYLPNEQGSRENVRKLTEDLVKKISRASGFNLKSAAAGLYGATRDTEKCCSGGVKKLKDATAKIARALYAKDEESPAFLAVHLSKTGARTARLLVSAMKEIGPGAALAKTAVGKVGLYGYKDRTAKLALQACTDLHHEAGLIAADLSSRRTAGYEKITTYLKEHSKTAKCQYAALLLEAYPSAPVEAPMKTASGLAGWFQETEATREATPSVREILSRSATDFLASEEPKEDADPKEAEMDKTAGDGANRAKYLVKSLIDLVDVTKSDDLFKLSIDGLLFLLKKVPNLNPEELREFRGNLTALMTMRLKPRLAMDKTASNPRALAKAITDHLVFLARKVAEPTDTVALEDAQAAALTGLFTELRKVQSLEGADLAMFVDFLSTFMSVYLKREL